MFFYNIISKEFKIMLPRIPNIKTINSLTDQKEKNCSESSREDQKEQINILSLMVFNQRKRMLNLKSSLSAPLKEHAKLLKICLENFQHLWWTPQNLNHRNRFGNGDIEQELQEFLQNSKIQFTYQDLYDSAMNGLNGNDKALEFLRWIYGRASLLIMPEIVLVFEKGGNLSFQEIIGLLRSDDFLKCIYDDNSYFILNMNKVKNSKNQSSLTQLESFMQILAITFLLVIRNYSQNPFYQQYLKLEEKFIYRKLLRKE